MVRKRYYFLLKCLTLGTQEEYRRDDERDGETAHHKGQKQARHSDEGDAPEGRAFRGGFIEEAGHVQGLEKALDFEALETEDVPGQATHERGCGKAKSQEPPVGHPGLRGRGAGLQGGRGAG